PGDGPRRPWWPRSSTPARPESFRAGTGMGGVVRPHELVGTDMRVPLRRRQPAVAEELLDHPEVGAGVQQVCRERVAQRVRAHPPRDPARLRALPHDRVDRAHGEPAAAAGGGERARGARRGARRGGRGGGGARGAPGGGGGGGGGALAARPPYGTMRSLRPLPST